MPANSVIITLAVKDQITGAIRGIRSQFDGLASPIAGINGKMSGMGVTASSVGNTIRNWAIGITAAATALGGVMHLMGGFKEAMNMETAALGSANNLSGAFKISLDEAKAVNSELSKALGKEAMTLPGQAKDFTAISSGIGGSVSQAVGGNLAAFKAIINPLTIQLGLIGQGATGGALSASQVAIGTGKFLSEGSGLAETMQMDIFEKSPALKRNIKEQIELAGFTDKTFAKATAAQRLAVLQEATKLTANPAYIAELKKTTGATLGQLSDTFFDPEQGIFGWLRAVKLPGSQKTTTALKSFQMFLASLQDFVGVIGLKIGIDPMQAVSDFFRWFAKAIKDMTDIVKKGSNTWNDLTYLFTKKLSDSLGSLTISIGRIDWKALGFNFGDSLAKILLDDELGKALEDSLVAALTGFAKMIQGALQASIPKLQKELFGEPIQKPEILQRPATTSGSKLSFGDALINSLGRVWDSVLPSLTPPKDIMKPLSTLPNLTPPKDIVKPLSTLPNLTPPKDIVKPLSTLPPIGSKAQPVAYNTFTVNGTNMSGAEIAMALNAEYKIHRDGILA